MRRAICKLIWTVGVAALTAGSAFVAGAQCLPRPGSLKPMSWNTGAGSARLLQAGFPHEDESQEPSIVGMWHVVFTAKTMNGSPIADTQIEDALVAWHRDGIEIMNSGRPAQDGDFCMGVWERAGERSYVLNHFVWRANNIPSGNPPGVVGQLVVGARLQEAVTVGPHGEQYSGTFQKDVYDASGNLTASYTGKLKGTRITINTKFSDLL